MSDNGSIPTDSYFSFIEPARPWTDYFWLFQALVYRIYSFSGYYGLIFLRAAVFTLLCLFVLQFFLKGTDLGKQRMYFLILFSFCCMVIALRYTLVRPHMFSYFFIIVFLYILEYKPSKVWCLPILSVLWVNFHGIEYPVMLLIIGSYLCEFLLKRFTVRTPLGREQIIYLLSLVLSISAVYATPHGVNLLHVPFVTTEYASLYIQELRPLRLDVISTFVIRDFLEFSPFTLFSLIMIVALISLIRALLSRHIRISLIILFAGGCFLAIKTGRFIIEAVLLSIPLLKNCPSITFNEGRSMQSFSLILLIAFVVVMPFLHLRNIFPSESGYPLSKRNLPEGIATFLNHINTGGKLLNYPNNGGYYQWRLYPHYKIFMDMEIPFLFHDEDIYYSGNAFVNAPVLEKMLRAYSPSFIAVPKGVGRHFSGLIKKHPAYVPVFFDDVEDLYMNKEKHRDIAERYELKSLQPGMIEGLNIGTLKMDERNIIADEISRMMRIYPDVSIHLQVMALIHNANKDFAKGTDFAERLIRNDRSSARGYFVMAESLLGMEKYDEAIDFYNKAIKRSSESDHYVLHKKISKGYSKLEKYDEAYKSMKKAVNIFSPSESPNDLFMLGALALELGKNKEALMLLKFAYVRTPEEDREMKERIWEKLSLFDLKADALRDSLVYKEK